MGSIEDSASLGARTASGDDAARDAILRENLSLVHHVARQLSRSLAVEADFDELVRAGTIGLLTAVKAFDPRRAATAVPRATLGPAKGPRHRPSSRASHAPARSHARGLGTGDAGRHRRSDTLALAVRGRRIGASLAHV